VESLSPILPSQHLRVSISIGQSLSVFFWSLVATVVVKQTKKDGFAAVIETGASEC
jgi:hypothetical protein